MLICELLQEQLDVITQPHGGLDRIATEIRFGRTYAAPLAFKEDVRINF